MPTVGARISEWASERIDADAYLARLGVDGPLPPTVDTLRRLHLAHVLTIPFENLDVILGRAIRIDLDSIQDKLVHRGRGGYCFEHNLLFTAVLERLGFRVTRLAARVLMAAVPRAVSGGEEIRPRTHMTSWVEAGGHTWLADVGFGGAGPLEPVEFRTGATSRQGGWEYDVTEDPDGGWLLRSTGPQGSYALYAFTAEPQHHIDYVLANHFISTYPTSPFARRVFAERPGPDQRLMLQNRTLTVERPDGTRSGTELDAAQFADALTGALGIPLSGEEVAQAFAVASGPAPR